MIAQLSLPSWREDQPSPVETTLAGSEATHPTALGGMLLNQYAGLRAGNQQDYHNYMSAVNALQLRNMGLQQQEMQGKTLIDAVRATKDNPYAASFLQSVPNLAPLFGGADTTPLTQNALTLQGSEILKNTGQGAQGFGVAGMSPDSIAARTGGNYGVPAQVQAAREQAQGRIAAAGIGAGAAKGPTVTIPTGPLASPIMTKLQGQGAVDYLRQHPEAITGTAGSPVAGLLPNAPGAVTLGAKPTQRERNDPQTPSGQSGLANTNATSTNNNTGNQPQPAPGSVDTLLRNAQRIARGAYDDMVAGIKANGGKPKLGTTPSGKIVLYGGSGKIYEVPQGQ